ncbi:hypothetical protein JOF48_000565 [Arthrobacter stackebrandtii]|uniref:Uncharacterized protein n=1 Tax=Arthrobacter stackebrandtii TaxID=272161 RepID=A0ABS4YSJ9_9MICC|nr:hypothetical protein [Arthrobacter stackebrandtii]MBP2411766.1 hypothetical protein [Arthrobacter stackebrandtii]PYG99158.1 hypothetical protein CVV67_16525 [Arthrobacter stackebrandtii]
MTATISEPADIDDPDVWATQTELGKEFGWTAVEMGHCLLLLGLRMDREPTASAKDNLLVHTLERFNGTGAAYTQTLWHKHGVSERVYDYSRLVGGLDNATAIIGGISTKPAAKAKQKKPTIAQLAEQIEALSQRIQILEYGQGDSGS